MELQVALKVRSTSATIGPIEPLIDQRRGARASCGCERIKRVVSPVPSVMDRWTGAPRSLMVRWQPEKAQCGGRTVESAGGVANDDGWAGASARIGLT